MAPRSMKPAAIILPIPREPPVMSAVRPSSENRSLAILLPFPLLIFGGAAVGIALLWAGSAGKIALVAAFFLGLGMGAEVDIIVFLMSRYFGLRALGTAFGFGFGSFSLAGALGVFLMGAGFDLSHSYSVPLGGFFVAMLSAIALMTRLGPYRYIAQRTGELAPMATVEAGSDA